MTLGLTGSAALSLHLSNQCAEAIDSFFKNFDQNITISEFSATVTWKNRSGTVTFDDINAVLPESVMNIVDHLENAPKYCGRVPFAIGMGITLAVAFGLAAIVMVLVMLSDLQKEREERREYTPLLG